MNVTKFSRVDLAGQSARSLRLTTVRPRDSRVDQAFAPLLRDAQHFVGGAIYRRSGVRHILTATASMLELDPPAIGMAVLIDCGLEAQRVARVPKQYVRESEFLSAVGSLEGPILFDVRVDFAYGADTEGELWFPLPTRLPGIPGADGDLEIRSVAGVKPAMSATDAPEFAFELARWNDETAVTVEHPFSSDRFGSDVLTDAFEQASRVASALVRRSLDKE
jgi:hypothetical protein